MIFFKVLLIILVAAPLVGFALFFYLQMLAYIRGKNEREEAEIKADAASLSKQAAVKKKNEPAKKQTKTNSNRKKDARTKNKRNNAGRKKKESESKSER